MTVQIYNVLAKKKEPIKPVAPGRLGVYVCGLTVYGRCHIGHLRCYLSFDAILRYLAYRGYDVHYVRNITDIDDKIIVRAQEIASGKDGEWRRGEAYATYTEEQWQERLAEDEAIRGRAEGADRHLAEVVADHFVDIVTREDLAPFDMLEPRAQPRVSKHMPEIIALIEQIIDREFAYEVDGDVYFDVPAYHRATSAYGKLSGRDYTQLVEGARIEPSDKKRSGPDFALWKSSKPDEPMWDSPWGKGRPGWHIECSAMSVNELGQPFDLHGGGKDLIFPHHENEIAQSEAAAGKPFCNAWAHVGFVTVDGVKMSKSLGNFITVKEALEMAEPEAWRLLVLSSHYAKPIDLSRTREIEGQHGGTVRGTIDIACGRLEYFYETLIRAADLKALHGDAPGERCDDPRSAGIISGFEEAMDDDFNTARALTVIGEGMKYLNELCDMKKKQVTQFPGAKPGWLATIFETASDLTRVSRVLGLLTRDPETALEQGRDFAVRSFGLDRGAILARIAERDQARQSKDWARADALRDELLAMRVEVRDTPQGTAWKILR